MSKKNPVPTWHLAEGYGASCDSFNWKLMKKFGESWKTIGFYATPEKMLAGLYRKMCRTTKPADPDLLEHVEAISERVQAAAARLSKALNHYGLGRANTAPATAKTYCTKE